MNKTIWSEVWNRALREPLGVYLRTTDATHARQQLHYTKPAWAKDYRLHMGPGDGILLVVAPGHGFYEPSDRHQLTLVRSDLEEPLP